MLYDLIVASFYDCRLLKLNGLAKMANIEVTFMEMVIFVIFMLFLYLLPLLNVSERKRKLI